MNHNLNLNNFELSEIESIELLGERDTIDITVEDTHMFYANDIYTHNSGMEQEQVTLSSIGESLGNARAADVVIGIGRTGEQSLNDEATIGILKNRNGGAGFYLPAHFDTSKVFIEIKPDVKPETIMQKKPQNNKKASDKQIDESEKSMNAFLNDSPIE